MLVGDSRRKTRLSSAGNEGVGPDWDLPSLQIVIFTVLETLSWVASPLIRSRPVREVTWVPERASPASTC